MVAILNFRIFFKNAKHKNPCISKTVLDRVISSVRVFRVFSSLVLLTPGILRGAWTLFCPWILKLVDFFVLLRLRVPFE